jgi:SAM-dependent methyltransferase
MPHEFLGHTGRPNRFRDHLTKTERRARRRPEEEMDRIASLLGWRAGTTFADVGAGTGSFAVRAAARTDRVYATEVHRRNLSNIRVIAAGEHSTNLPDDFCDSILIRGAYHHFPDPAGINGSLFRALRPGGSVAVVDFRARFWLGLFVPVRGLPANGGRHGIDPVIVREEFEAFGFQFVQLIDPWAGDHYAAVFRKPVPAA